ncbi:MAG: peptidylprolyl isomerase [Kangiellaceae bacterium]|nr:peptidylprolyl isomerase [Kangiellaceae bacterium]
MPLPVISVNGRVIDEKELSDEIQYHPAPSAEAAIQKAGQALVIRQLLKQQLEEKAIAEVTEEQAIESLIDKNAKYQTPSEDDCVRYFEQNKDKFVTAPIMEVSHILLAVARDDIEGRIKKKQQAEKLIDSLLQDQDLFTKFVVDYSDCPSSKTQGSLGQLSKGQTVPEFERQVFPLDEGLHNKPLESRYGYHIVFINKKIEGNQLEYEMVKEKIKDYLNHRRYRQSVSDYLYRLVEESEIEGIELQLDQENIFIG